MKPRLLPRERYPRFSRFAFRGWRGESALHMRHDFREKLPGSLIARIIEEFRWRRVFDDCAVTHEQHTIGYPSGKTHFMGYHDHGHLGMGQLHYYVQDLGDHLGVQGGRGLVE